VDTYKEMILRVEADNYEAFQLRNWGANSQAPGAARSDSMPMLSRNRVFDRWWSKHFSWQLWWKTIISAGLAGSVLFVLALHMSVPGPITHFARFIWGYLGLVFCAVSLGCGVRVLIEWRSGSNRISSPSGRNSLRHFLTGFANLFTSNSRNVLV
jgi:hypothetical protein